MSGAASIFFDCLSEAVEGVSLVSSGAGPALPLRKSEESSDSQHLLSVSRDRKGQVGYPSLACTFNIYPIALSMMSTLRFPSNQPSLVLHLLTLSRALRSRKREENRKLKKRARREAKRQKRSESRDRAGRRGRVPRPHSSSNL